MTQLNFCCDSFTVYYIQHKNDLIGNRLWKCVIQMPYQPWPNPLALWNPLLSPSKFCLFDSWLDYDMHGQNKLAFTTCTICWHMPATAVIVLFCFYWQFDGLLFWMLVLWVDVARNSIQFIMPINHCISSWICVVGFLCCIFPSLNLLVISNGPDMKSRSTKQVQIWKGAADDHCTKIFSCFSSNLLHIN